jgi:4-hydroxybenzoate polyprenyltransferase
MENPLKKTLIGLAKLTRFNEYVYFVLISSLLGVISAQGELTGRLFVLLLANWLGVGFAFMLNDIEDAPEDAFSEKNFDRNPISSGLISPHTARIATFVVGVTSAVLFALLGLWPFIFGIASLMLGFLYSFKSIRLKAMPYVELISHSLLLAGLPFLCGYFSFNITLNRFWFWPFIFITAVNMLIVLHGELSDLARDQKARLRQTAVQLGQRAATNLLIALVILVLSAGVFTFFVINLVPAWVILVAAILAIVLILPGYIKVRGSDPEVSVQEFFRKPLERAAALALILYFLLPWLNQIFPSGWF